MKSAFSRFAGLAVVGIVAAGAQLASAQPGHGPGPGPGGMPTIEQTIASVRAQLALNTSQQGMFDSALAAAKAARAANRTNMEQVHAVLVAELAKAEPDLAAVAALADQARANEATSHKQVRDQWLALYATFTPAQKGVVRDVLAKRVARMDAFRARMQERFKAGSN